MAVTGDNKPPGYDHQPNHGCAAYDRPPALDDDDDDEACVIGDDEQQAPPSYEECAPVIRIAQE